MYMEVFQINVPFQVTGENCRCQNNTVSDNDHCRRRQNKHEKEGDRPHISSDFFTASSSASESVCQQFQCSKCKEYYVGSPTDNHQCYRQMTVDTDYCLDPKTQSKCYAGGQPAPLEHGQTVYFAVLPKVFLNLEFITLPKSNIGLNSNNILNIFILFVVHEC